MKQIKLTQGKFVIVDKEDYEWLSKYKWCYRRGKIFKNGIEYGNAVTGIWNKNRKNNDNVTMHRFIMKCPKGKQIDHINHNPLDNRRINLRIVDGTLNNMNRRGVKGYYWDEVNKQWKVELFHYKKRIWLGRYNTELEARQAYEKGVAQYYG